MTLLVYIPLQEVVNNLKLTHEGSPVIVKQANTQAQENFVTLLLFYRKNFTSETFVLLTFVNASCLTKHLHYTIEAPAVQESRINELKSYHD